MTVGSIPWTSIVAWCEYHRIDGDVADVVIDVIRRLDIDRAERAAAKAAMEQRQKGRKR